MPSLADFFDDSDDARLAKGLGLTVEDLQMVFGEFDTDGSGMIDEVRLYSGSITQQGVVSERVRDTSRDSREGIPR